MPPTRNDHGAPGADDRPGLSPLGRRLLQRIDSDEPLEDVIKAVVGSLDQLAAPDLAELLTAVGRRYRRERGSRGDRGERGASPFPPNSPDSPDSDPRQW